MIVRRSALSMSPFAASLLAGPPRAGLALGKGFVLAGADVIALTAPGALRMPNGIEAELRLLPGDAVVVGGGELRTSHEAVEPGPVWDSRPHPRVALSVTPRIEVRVDRLAGRGAGLTPLGDDLLVGLVAGAALGGSDARAVAERAARQTTSLSATLLRLAADGRLPEAAHILLEQGDPGPLLRFGATSGTGIAVGLALASNAPPDRGESFAITLPLPDGDVRFELFVAAPTPLPYEQPAVDPEGSALACMSSRR